ncbi:MAG: hypothetical protein ACRED5_18815 [Propylenella sp.]
MSIGAILEVGIGLIFVYLLLGLVVSALQEVIAALIGLRSKYLMEGLSTILREARDDCWLARRHILPWSNKLDEGSDLFKAVASHALVNGITPSTLPSYVPAGNFATALIETLRGGATGSVASEVEKAIGALPDGPAKQALSALFVDAKGDLDAFKKSVETWFDGAMDRVSGVYKRWTQWFTLFFGVAVAIALNVNTIEIGGALWRDPILREAAVKAAEAYVERCKATPTAEDCVPPKEEAPPAGVQGTTGTETGTQHQPNAQDSLKAFKGVVDRVDTQLKEIGYPVGWSDEDVAAVKAKSFNWVVAIFGWLITGLAVSLGAPFWFDMLKTFLNIRGAGGKPKPSGTPQDQPTT